MPTLAEALQDPALHLHCPALAVMSVDELERGFRAQITELKAMAEPGAAELGESVLTRERLLGIAEWGALLDQVQRRGTDGLVAIVRTWGRGRVLCGPSCDDVRLPLARVISEKDLLRIIISECGVPPEVARRVVGLLQEDEGERWRHARRVLDRAANPSAYLPYKPLYVGRFLMWGTYSRDPLVAQFDGFTDEEIEASLGVLPRPGQRILLMTYALDDGIVARFPTIAEAAASEPWNAKFRPSPGGQCGFTEPNDGFEYLEKQPEVVHEVVEIDSVRQPLRLLDTWLRF